MAADDPYFLDFLFNNVTDVHFGNPWIILWGAGVGLHVNVQVTFPGEAGGTPGFTLASPPIGSRSQVVLKQSLVQDIHTDAGLALRGFKMGVVVDPFDDLGAVVLECSGPLADRFTLKWDHVNGHGPDFGAFLISSDFMSAGKILRIDFDTWTGNGANPAPWAHKTVVNHANLDPIDFTMKVDPKKLTLTPHN